MNQRVDESAIQPDVPEATSQVPTETPAPFVSAREKAMESIAANRITELAKEGVDISTEDPADPAPADPPAPATEFDQLAAQLAQDDRGGVSPNQMVRVKVDGEEREVPYSEVVSSYQKQAAATKRLQEATSILALAKAQASELRDQGSGQAQNNGQAVDEPGSEEKLGKIKQVFSKLYEGDEDGAAQDMLNLMAQGAKATQPAIDPNLVANLAVQQLAVQNAYGQVKADYPALFENTERGVILGSETVRRMNEKESLGIPKDQALRESCDEVASLFGVERGGRQSAEPRRTVRDEKLARKDALDNIESASVAAGNVASPHEVQNVSSVIQQMAASRLGQSLNRNN